MVLSKLLWIVFVGVLLLSFCNADKDVSYSDISALKVDTGKLMPLKKEKEIVLDSGEDVIGSILIFKMVDDNFLIGDPIHSRQCYLFDGNGKLLKKIGRSGEGPGEYVNLLAACISNDRIFLIASVRINIYDKNGEFIKNASRPFRGICNSAYPGPNGGVFALSYNRYNKRKDTIYQLDRDGNLIKSFSPVEDLPPVFDTFFPQTGLCIVESGLFQYYNFKYALSLFDLEGNKIKEIKLSSPFYTPPDFGNANVKGHKKEKEYRATFTQVNGFFKYSKGYVSLLINWKNTKDWQYIFEFWSNDFKRIGYYELKYDDYPLGVYNDRIITANFDKETMIAAWKFF
jgi:hypothetical protein